MSPNSSANPEDSETATFINGGDVPTVKVVSEADAADSSEAGSAQDPKKCCKCCCSFCTLKCSAISAACVLALLAIVIGAGYYRYASKLTGKASSADSEEWEAKLGGDRAGVEEVPLRELSGIYELVSFDDSYDAYLSAMGTPGMVLGMIKGMAEFITVKAPVEEDGEWVWNVKSDFSDRASSFVLGEAFTTKWGTTRDKGTMDKTCSLESPNVLVCNVEEKSRGWFMIHRIIFSQEGLVVEINFESENVSTKKYYSKISEEEMVEKEEEDSDGAPFSSDDEEDEDFWNDDDFKKKKRR